MEIKFNQQNQADWDQFIIDNIIPASFLQSWEWGEFNKNILNNAIDRVSITDNNELKMIATVIGQKLPLKKSFWYCPRGVIWDKNYMDQRMHGYGLLMKEIKKRFSSEIFFRIGPPYEFRDFIDGFIKRLGFIKPKILARLKQPGKTLVLNLNQGGKNILTQMHHKTRYNIRLAEKKGIIIRLMTEETKIKDITSFQKLTKVTSDRDQIHSHPDEYYQKLINYFFNQTKNLKLKMYLAEYQGEPLSAIIVVYFGTTATYLHGASSNKHRHLMPNHAIQWQAIKDAIQNKMTIYDFWGVSDTKPAWSGITRFKKGFGGRTIRLLGTWDYVINRKWYKIFRLLKIIKQLIPNSIL